MQQYSNRSDTNPSHNRPLSVQAVALAELASYIEESAQNDNVTSVFKLSDLTKLYVERLNQLGFNITGKVNSTRLKERLLTVLPELRLYPHGQEILLAYEKDIGSLINLACEEDHDSDAMVLTKSDLIHSLERLSTSISDDIFPDVTALIIDGAAVVNMRKPKAAKTFGEYANMNLIPYFCPG